MFISPLRNFLATGEFRHMHLTSIFSPSPPPKQKKQKNYGKKTRPITIARSKMSGYSASSVSKSPFTRQKNWVRTRQEKGPNVTFLSVLTVRIMFLRLLRTRVFRRFGAIDVYDPKLKENTGPDQFFDSYASLFNNFTDCMRSTVVTCLTLK